MTLLHMPSAETLERLRRDTPDGPVVLLNLLSYREPGGREAFVRYSQITGPLIAGSGGSVLFGGRAGLVLTGSDVEWDDVLLVSFPTIDHFLGMIESDTYTEKAAPIRAEALKATLWMAIEPFPGYSDQ